MMMCGPGVPQVFAVPNVKGTMRVLLLLLLLLCHASNLPGKYDACGEMPRADHTTTHACVQGDATLLPFPSLLCPMRT
ncbi:hypothetical protein F4801DRAFT_540070 [Xylaria longipes]|nr:hypothetical protein F4801DRAFT_540070 [Xylaria longipes]